MYICIYIHTHTHTTSYIIHAYLIYKWPFGGCERTPGPGVVVVQDFPAAPGKGTKSDDAASGSAFVRAASSTSPVLVTTRWDAQ